MIFNRSFFWSLFALAGYLAVTFAPCPEGLSVEGKNLMAIMFAAVVLWAVEIVPVAVSSIIIIILLTLTNVMGSFANAMVGFTSPIPYFLVGVLVIGKSVQVTGLAGRLARTLVLRGAGSPVRIFCQLLVALPFLPLVAPSAITRNAILIPAYEEIFQRMDPDGREKFSRGVMLVLGILNPFASSTFITGGLAPMTTATLLGGFTWFKWFALMSIPYYTLLLLGGGFLYLWNLKNIGRKGILISQNKKEEDCSLSADQKKVLLVLVLTTSLWLTDFIHHLNPTIPALIGAVLLLLPRVGVLSWGRFEKESSWSTFFVLGATLSLAEGLITSGAADWFAKCLINWVQFIHSPLLFVVFMILIIAAVHLVIPNMSACIAFLIPVVISFARGVGINPVVCGLLVSIVVDAVILYPVQTATNLIAYEAGYFKSSDVLILGLFLLLATVLVALLVAVPYWGLLGLKLLG